MDVQLPTATGGKTSAGKWILMVVVGAIVISAGLALFNALFTVNTYDAAGKPQGTSKIAFRWGKHVSQTENTPS